MQNELSYELIKENLKRKSEYDENTGYKDLLELEKRGIQLTPMQANLMFQSRDFGKTFMTYTRLLLDNRNKKHFTVNIYDAKKDPDSILFNEISKVFWVEGFTNFMRKYGKDFKIEILGKGKATYTKIK